MYLWAQILGRWGRRPQSIHRPLDRGMMLLQLCRWKFLHKETVSDFFRQNLNFSGKTRCSILV